MQIKIASENAVIIYLGDDISPETLSLVRMARDKIRLQLRDFVIDMIPSYTSLVVVYNTGKIRSRELIDRVADICHNLKPNLESHTNNLELPVYYSEETGMDLARLAREKSMDTETLISLHCQRSYLVYAIGFAPGFAYLGTLDSRLVTPRLATPRTHVPAGSVAIADNQTAVYPSDSPGGWNLIGNCPTPLFEAHKSPCMPFDIGDSLSFRPISRKEFLRLGGRL
jgi:KipI family sensor histidine kinase inhibitor